MGRRHYLTSTEKVKIDVLSSKIYSGKEIGDSIRRCKSTVNAYLAQESGEKTKTTRPASQTHPVKQTPDCKYRSFGKIDGRRCIRGNWFASVEAKNLKGVTRVRVSWFRRPVCALKTTIPPHYCPKKMSCHYAFVEAPEWKRIIFSNEKNGAWMYQTAKPGFRGIDESQKKFFQNVREAVAVFWSGAPFRGEERLNWLCSRAH